MTTTLPLLAFISDDILDGNPTFKTITIRWERGSNMPTIRGQWIRLPDGRIETTYTRDELGQCLKVFELTNLVK